MPTQGKKASAKKAESTTGGEEEANIWENEALKEKVYSALVHLLELDLARLWTQDLPEEVLCHIYCVCSNTSIVIFFFFFFFFVVLTGVQSLLNLFTRMATSGLESQANVKSRSVKRCLFIIIALLVSKFKQARRNILTPLPRLVSS
jgi:hypothetical protein